MPLGGTLVMSSRNQKLVVVKFRFVSAVLRLIYTVRPVSVCRVTLNAALYPVISYNVLPLLMYILFDCDSYPAHAHLNESKLPVIFVKSEVEQLSLSGKSAP